MESAFGARAHGPALARRDDEGGESRLHSTQSSNRAGDQCGRRRRRLRTLRGIVGRALTTLPKPRALRFLCPPTATRRARIANILRDLSEQSIAGSRRKAEPLARFAGGQHSASQQIDDRARNIVIYEGIYRIFSGTLRRTTDVGCR